MGITEGMRKLGRPRHRWENNFCGTFVETRIVDLKLSPNTQWVMGRSPGFIVLLTFPAVQQAVLSLLQISQ